MDKLREEFEEWFSEKYPLKKPSVRKLKLWEAWQASRASIVVELPKSVLTTELRGYHPEYCMMAFDVKQSIRSIGLSIKGE